MNSFWRGGRALHRAGRSAIIGRRYRNDEGVRTVNLDIERRPEAALPYAKASTWRESLRLCAGSARTQANVPALTAIIKSRPKEVGSRKSEGGRRRAEVGGQRTEVGGRRSEVGGYGGRSSVRYLGASSRAVFINFPCSS
jgi:hypothetical protein